jgi:uncharacterized protein (DUF2126 family)/transglutaminase-like putative cysteine protease
VGGVAGKKMAFRSAHFCFTGENLAVSSSRPALRRLARGTPDLGDFMTLQVALTHRTAYRYDRAVSLGPHILRLRPAPHCRTPILAYSLNITPKSFLNWQQDPFGNYLARVVVPDKTSEFIAVVDLVVDLAAINPFDFFVEESAANWPFAYEPALAGELRPYLETLAGVPLLETYIANLASCERTTIGFVCDLNRRLSSDIAYRLRMEPGVQAPDDTLLSKSGSCRDTAWLLVQILRRLGLAARFVSGYLLQLRADAEGPARDSAELHAWAEVYIPGAGWIGLDPTSGLVAGEGHIPLAATSTPITAAPITGTHGDAKVDFSAAMHIERIGLCPRVSEPYNDAQWQAILAAGGEVEQRLQAGDVRLSMGGEPTFVVAGDALAPEWTIAALGPTKRRYADKLARRLRERFAGGGLLHYGLGKWYPGEQTARWAFAIHWRADGKALWNDPTLIAEEEPVRKATIADAAMFAAELAGTLGLAHDSALPAYEDAAHFLLIERKLPLGVRPEDNALADPAERQRVMRVFDQGLDRPAGYVLPLLVADGADGPRFRTERWSPRRGHLYLLPGDSPIGLRLPLAGLPEIDFVDYPGVEPVDPFADARALWPGGDLLEAYREGARDAVGPVRTALAIEPRGGHLCVFLPPLADGEHYAALLAAIEATAEATGLALRLEGYAPPFDARIRVIKITPDPGVVEVNIHPAASWREAVAITTAIYEEAHRVGLSAEKFALDGRHVSTGGGSHIVVGGMTPADSPFLRRPDLLASILNYWQNHPSLSYLFAGLFVGPTSQAPRLDEGRDDSLYELEIALGQIPAPGGVVAPWLVDRLFRNLLVDVTGNTHRAEICIDKLYAPEGPMGRMGLVEFRAFEMPPHPHMSLAEQLLIRALVAWLWGHPYRRPLVRWGTTLHDRFALPYFLWADFEAVLADLRGAAMNLKSEWFRPHLEFRFPRCGTLEAAEVRLELRQALEPWLVLGEPSGGAARPVDSSLERLQVLVGNSNPQRYAVACNGFALPLAPTTTIGQSVAGVRFRAWQAIEGFHPTIPPHVPLTFDVIDTWTGRSIGGCRYHAAHPGGRTFHALPVNQREAESRRRARFESMGHSAGGMAIKEDGVHPDFPLTLDLRRVA